MLAAAAAAAGAAGLSPGALADSGSAHGLDVAFLPARRAPAGGATVMPIRVVNRGPGRAVGVTLAVSAPSWVRLARAGCARRPSGLRCPLRDLASGAAVTARFRVVATWPHAYRVVARATAQTINVATAAP